MFYSCSPPTAAGANEVSGRLLQHTQGFANLIGVDVSAGAMAAHARQFIAPQNDLILWLVDDVPSAQRLPTLGTVQLWPDRAILRVLPAQLQAYRRTLDQMTRPLDSWVLLGGCLPDGTTRLGDRNVQPYNLTQTEAFSGAAYMLAQPWCYGDNRCEKAPGRCPRGVRTVPLHVEKPDLENRSFYVQKSAVQWRSLLRARRKLEGGLQDVRTRKTGGRLLAGERVCLSGFFFFTIGRPVLENQDGPA